MEEAISQLKLEYCDLSLEIVIITVLHFLRKIQGTDFADRRHTTRTLMLEAMLTPEWELRAPYIRAKEEGKPPRAYQNG